MAFRQTSSFLAQMMQPSLPQLAPPRFPTFRELVRENQIEQLQPRKPDPGLFETLLGDPAVLHALWIDDPDAFNPKVGPLLLDLVTGRKSLSSLSPEEMLLLNEATIEFAQYKKPEPKQLIPKVEQPSAEQADGSDYEGDLEWNERGSGPRTSASDVAAGRALEPDETKLPTRWWEHRQ
jgi:hypothetical protein